LFQAPWHFLPLPQGHGSLRPIFAAPVWPGWTGLVGFTDDAPPFLNYLMPLLIGTLLLI
jgi:hypothetical protein